MGFGTDITVIKGDDTIKEEDKMKEYNPAEEGMKAARKENEMRGKYGKEKTRIENPVFAECFDRLAKAMWNGIGGQDWEHHAQDISWYLGEFLGISEEEVVDEIMSRILKLK